MIRARALVPAVIALVCAAVVVAPVPVVISAVLAVPLLLVLPGYALLEVFDADPLGAGRLVLVPGLSIALDIAIALVLNFLPGGLTAHSWAIALVVVVLAASVAAAFRAVEPRARPLRPELRTREIALLAVAGIVVAGAVVLMRTPLSASNAQSYTILSLVRTSPATVDVDVQSGEFEPTHYRLVVRSADSTLHRVKRFMLAPGARMSITLPDTGTSQSPLLATLYRGNSGRSYRQVELAPPRS